MAEQIKTESNSEKLEALISDYGPSEENKKNEKKYEDVVRAMQWARHLRRMEEYKNISISDLIETAMIDVLAHKVDASMIEEAVIEDKAAKEAEKKRRADKERAYRELSEGKTVLQLPPDEK